MPNSVAKSALNSIGLAFLVFTLSPQNAWTSADAPKASVESSIGIMPKNNLQIPVGLYLEENISQKKFETIISTIVNLHKPFAEAEGATLSSVNDWESTTVNAFARRTGDKWEILMFGGLARHPTLSEDGFAAVVCHELGHHLGGAPRSSGFFSSKLTNEGQADYYATLKCMRRYFDDQRARGVWEVPAKTDPYAEKICNDNHIGFEDQTDCLRNSMAGLSLATLFNSIRKKPNHLSFEHPSSRKTQKTYHGHPKPQCRLDTYFSGSVCSVSYTENVDHDDATQGVCLDYTARHGARPACWYRPE